jgi:hypothetical protein
VDAASHSVSCAATNRKALVRDRINTEVSCARFVAGCYVRHMPCSLMTPQASSSSESPGDDS